MPDLRVFVWPEQPRHGEVARDIRRTLVRAGRLLRVGLAALEVHIVSDRTMGEVNLRSRGKRGPTTVLSFSANGGFPYLASGRARYLGEIYLAPQCIARRGESPARLAMHGLLHLLGYTHDGERDTMSMERVERRLLGAPNAGRRKPKNKQLTNKRQ